MPCPTVTAIGGDTTGGDTIEGAIKLATKYARGRAARICEVSGGGCTGISTIPESTEFLESDREIDENGVEHWTVLLKCTFRCERKRGCWPLATSEKSEPVSDASPKEETKYFEKSQSQA